MAERMQVYKCNSCGIIVQVAHGGMATLFCCNIPMELLEGQTSTGANTDHLPLVKKTEDGLTVKVGAEAHPMEDGHYIEWIEIFTENISMTRFFNPGDIPEANFPIEISGPKMNVLIYCNKHRLFKNLCLKSFNSYNIA
ncbi:desulfoferrodoxin family protein [Candidatus Riflebacteria bacterium]